jgi:aromatic-L-amino-acid decarboxylase
MVAAREKFLHERLGDGEWREENMERLKGRMVVLGSSATHSSTKKAAKILGLRFETIPVDGVDGYALSGVKLKTYLVRLRERELEPFFLTATMGTTDTCAVDDFEGISEVLKAYTQDTNRDVWVHVDAAHAGAALICPEVRGKIRANVFEDLHSFDTNMNKWMLINLDASCLFIKDRNWLTCAFSVNQAVYDNHHSEGGLVTDYREWQIPLSRRFRALKIWFVMRTYGVKGIREYIRKTIGLAEWFEELLKTREDLFETVAGPSFALVVFRLVGKVGQEGAAEDKLSEGNKLTRSLCDKANGSGKVWVTSTVLDGRYAIRFMTAVSTTEKKHIDMAFELFVKLAEEVQRAEV